MHILLSYLFHGSDGLTAKQFITALSLSNTENVHVEYKDLLLALNVSNLNGKKNAVSRRIKDY